MLHSSIYPSRESINQICLAMRQRPPGLMGHRAGRTGIRSAKPSTLWGHGLSNELEEEVDMRSMRSYYRERRHGNLFVLPFECSSYCNSHGRVRDDAVVTCERNVSASKAERSHPRGWECLPPCCTIWNLSRGLPGSLTSRILAP